MLNITNPAIEQLLHQAIEAHIAGRLPDADALYRRILTLQPTHAPSLNGMSALAIQVQHFDLAANLARRAIASRPDFAEAHGHLAAAQAALGHNDEALAAYRRAIELNPHIAATHNNLGLLQRKLGKNHEAVASFQKALELDPQYAKARDGLATAIKAAGGPNAIEEAISHYRHAIELKPNFAEAHYNLGVTLAESRRTEEAIACFRNALQLNPNFVEAFNNLAAQFLLLPGEKEIDEAIVCFQKSLALRPVQPEVFVSLGAALLRKRALAAAADAFRSAAKLNPQYSKAHYGLSVALREAGNFPAAIDACKIAVELDPQSIETRSALAMFYAAAGRTEEAIIAFRNALELKPDSPELQFQLAAITGQPIKTAPREYIASFFDDFAPWFDFHLVEHLHYRGPQLLRDALVSVAQPAPNSLDILDLGCGTGLCGSLFHPFARKLIGVDLSSAMVRVAKSRGIYADVRQNDLVSALRQESGACDLLIAGDVLIYIGDLDDTFAAAFNALRPGGLFAFTVERGETADVTLRQTLRFTHSKSYLESLAAKHGFLISCVNEEPLRKESGADIPALIVVLRKPA